MIVTFEKVYLQKLYETGKSGDKKHRFQPEIVARYIDRINTLKNTEKMESLITFHSFNYEV